MFCLPEKKYMLDSAKICFQLISKHLTFSNTHMIFAFGNLFASIWDICDVFAWYNLGWDEITLVVRAANINLTTIDIIPRGHSVHGDS